MKWFVALDAENHARPLSFQYAQIWFRNGTRFSQREGLSFRQEFYRLIAHVDDNWEREMAGTPQKIWNDFSGYPTLGKHVYLIRFEHRTAFKPGMWVIGTPKGGAFDPRWATEALLERIEEKKNKPNYVKLKAEHGLSELALLLHYGIPASFTIGCSRGSIGSSKIFSAKLARTWRKIQDLLTVCFCISHSMRDNSSLFIRDTA